MVEPAVAAADTARLRRRAARLAWFTIAYNMAEGVIAVAAGLAAGSVALLSFGLDSGIEVLSAVAISWQFARGGGRAEERERRTLRLIAVAFAALAGYVVVESVSSLRSGAEADASAVGIGLAVSSLIVMPLLTAAKRRTGTALGSASVLADSTQTLLCTYLSAVLLVGLVLNAAWGLAWADPLAGLVIAGLAAREARNAWHGDACCAASSRASAASHPQPAGHATSPPSAASLMVDSCSSPCCEEQTPGR